MSSIEIKKENFTDLINQVKSGKITIDEYQHIILENHKNEQHKKHVEHEKELEKPEHNIDEINSNSKARKQQIKKWHKENPGQTELEKINSNEEIIKEKIESLKEKGAIEKHLPKRRHIERFKEKLGNRLLISYILKNGKYRSGGFLTAVSDYYFVILGGQTDNRISFSIQFSDVQTIYVRKVNPKDLTKPIKPIATTRPKTSYPVKVDGIVVYYGKDTYDKKRFEGTHKYNNMLKYNKLAGNVKEPKGKTTDKTTDTVT